MADISALHLAANRCNNMFFVHEGRAYKLKHIDKKKKYWKCSKACPECQECNKEGCKGAIWRNQNVTAVITQNDRIKRCRADEHLAQKTEKKAVKKRNAEKTKSILVIYDEETSAVSAEPSTSGPFLIFK
ncbi:hypothetical protein T06_11666 [Trichinella sp. T6]|nr:hypothetical protein T06_11666 [Trichinella sp. T6]